MARIILGIIISVFFSTHALADDGDAVRQLTHLLFTVLGVLVAGRLAWQAFGRAVAVGEIPTFPRHMTSPKQYRLGGFVFVLFACGLFLLLVY